MARLKVAVYFDYICPYCFIAKNLADRLAKEFDIAVEWKGFLLHPEIPAGGVSLHEMGWEKERIILARMRVSLLADQLGIKMTFPLHLSSSRLALVMGQLAMEKGRFLEFHDAVFRGYWQEGKDIGNEAFLDGIAQRIGLEPGAVKEYVYGPRAEAILEQMVAEAQERGVDGVPVFFIGNFKVVGVQPYGILVKAVERALEPNKQP